MTRRDSSALHGTPDDLAAFTTALDRLRQGHGGHSPAQETSTSSAERRLSADPETIDQGLAQLVLSVVELLRQLLEKQGLRRMDQGELTDEEIERMGETFLRLNEKMDELKVAFGLEDEDLELQLGRLEDLIADDRG